MPAPQRTARKEDDIWDPAQAQAKAEGASLEENAEDRHCTSLKPVAQPVLQPKRPAGPACAERVRASAMVGRHGGSKMARLILGRAARLREYWHVSVKVQ